MHDVTDELEISHAEGCKPWPKDASLSTPPWRGQHIGDYQLVQCLGSGRTAAVWEVNCIGHSCAKQATEKLAMKLFYNASQDTAEIERECSFGKEAVKKDPIHFRNCIEVSSLISENGEELLFTVWTEVVGDEVFTMLQGASDKPPDAFSHFRDVATLVVDMFEAFNKIATPGADGKRYYDIDANLGNVFLSSDNQIMLIDYGSQAVCSGNSSNTTQNECEYMDDNTGSHFTIKTENWVRWHVNYWLFCNFVNLIHRVPEHPHYVFAWLSGKLLQFMRESEDSVGPFPAQDFYPGYGKKPRNLTHAERYQLRAEAAEEFIHKSLWPAYSDEISAQSSPWLKNVLQSGLKTMATRFRSMAPWPPEFIKLLNASLESSS